MTKTADVVTEADDQMATKKNNIHFLADVKKDSAFYKRLVAISNDENSSYEKADVKNLLTTIDGVVEIGSDISAHIVSYFPQYTLHDSRHLLNVLSFMERLVPKATVERLHPLELGLSILAAFCHDLAMVPIAEEWAALQDSKSDAAIRRDFDEFLYRRPADKAKLERLQAAVDGKDESTIVRYNDLQGYLRTDYLRERHTKAVDQTWPVLNWLEKIREARTGKADGFVFVWRDEDYSKLLTLIAASHGESLSSYKRRIEGELNITDGEAYDLGDEQKINLSLPVWLLRLADIMDFDQSRTPSIVYRHLGIDDTTSRKEWQKHMAISTVRWQDGTPPRLDYFANACQSPVIEKSIRKFCGWIDTELTGVSADIERLPDGHIYRLDLPACATPKVKAKGNCYRYVDVQFELQQDSVMDLLMGEALYGKPELCLRELVQNSLDALRMRDLRSQLRAKKVQGAPPVDPVFDRDSLQVHVTWGEEGDRRFIQVRDNGTGMTQEVLTSFFTQVGRSYYKSSEYYHEQYLIETHLENEKITPISQFGIGVLSAFMIADSIEVYTRPASGPPSHVTIHGPAELFWFQDLTPTDLTTWNLLESGTVIRLWLKGSDTDGFCVELEEDIQKSLYDSVYWSSHSRSDHANTRYTFDPRVCLGESIAWPLYPVLCGEGQNAITIDAQSRVTTILCGPYLEKADGVDRWCDSFSKFAWGPVSASDLSWATPCVVQDDSTGSRLAFWTLDESARPTNMEPEEWRYWTDELLPNRNRTQVFVNGVGVRHLELGTWLGVGARNGCLLWLDLRGAAAPELTADRNRLKTRPYVSWQSDCRSTQRRLLSKFLKSIGWLAMRTAVTADHDLIEVPILQRPNQEDPGYLYFDRSLIQRVHYMVEDSLNKRRALARDLDWALARDLDWARARARARDLALDRAHTFARARDLALDRALDRARDLNRDLDLDLARDLALDLALDLARDVMRYLHVKQANMADDSSRCLDLWCYFGLGLLFSQALAPDLARAMPAVQPLAIHGRSSDCPLDGPLLPRPEADQNGKVHPRPTLDLPAPFNHYDLMAPLTVVPFGALRQSAPAWSDDYRVALLFSLPFAMDKLPDKWREKRESIQEFLGDTTEVFMCVPAEPLWTKRFDDPEVDWAGNCVSALWDIDANHVLWTPGIVSREDCRKYGKTITTWFDEALADLTDEERKAYDELKKANWTP